MKPSPSPSPCGSRPIGVTCLVAAVSVAALPAIAVAVRRAAERVRARALLVVAPCFHQRVNYLHDQRAVDDGDEHDEGDADADGGEREAEAVAVELDGLQGVGRVRMEHARHDRQHERHDRELDAAEARAYAEACARTRELINTVL